MVGALFAGARADGVPPDGTLAEGVRVVDVGREEGALADGVRFEGSRAEGDRFVDVLSDGARAEGVRLEGARTDGELRLVPRLV